MRSPVILLGVILRFLKVQKELGEAGKQMMGLSCAMQVETDSKA